MKYDIDTEIILNRNLNPFIYIYMMFLILITLFLITFICLFRFKTYCNIYGIVSKENEEYSILLLSEVNETRYITDNNIFYLDNKKYTYKVLEIFKDYEYKNNKNYQIVKVSAKLDDKYIHNNMMIKLKIPKDNKRIILYFKEKKVV